MARNAYAALVLGLLVSGLPIAVSAEPAERPSDEGGLEQPGVFLETFDLDPSGPVNFVDSPFAERFHVSQTVTDYYQWEQGDAVDAQHGPDCSPPPATHRAETWDEYVFVCRNHVMTARAAPSYGATYMMPLTQVDLSGPDAVVSWEVSTMSMSARDWIDAWVTPLDDVLMVPIEHDGVAFQGTPRNAIHVRNGNGSEAWTVSVIRDFEIVGEARLQVPASFPFSAMTRTPMTLRIGSDQVEFTMAGVGTVRVPAAPSFERGVVQWAQHAYNPFKDDSGVAATWHWDTFRVEPALELDVNRVAPVRSIANRSQVRTLTFERPAAADDLLLFDAVCTIELDFGSGFEVIAKQPASEGNDAPETQSSYRVPVPTGVTQVRARFSGDGWYNGWPCLLENPIIVNGGPSDPLPPPPPTTSTTTTTTVPPTTSTTTTTTTVPPTTSTSTTVPPTTSTTTTTVPPTTTTTTVPLPTAPDRVARPSATALEGAVHLAWTVPDDGGSPIDDYDVRMRSSDGTWRREGVLFTDPEFTWSGLTNGVEYEFRVRAENAIGNGTYSESVFATPGATPPPSTTTTVPPTTSTTTSTSTTTVPPTTTPPNPERFETLPVGAVLPSGSECAARVRSAPENREGNTPFNATPGTDPHNSNSRVDGDFTGTTDEILQWVACKWGLDEDLVRAQTVVESWWYQDAAGDFSYDPENCHPDLRDRSPCPESVGLMQVRYPYHAEAFEDANAINSSAYNVDYAYSVWRACFEGELWWLNTVERGRQYEAGDVEGCLGVWYSGRWYTDPAVDYIGRVEEHLTQRTWERPYF